MRIAFLLRSFPVLSETFILNQITGLLDRGHDVDIFALGREPSEATHDDLCAHRLLQRTYYSRPVPKTRFAQLLQGASLFASNVHRNPRKVLRAINIFRQGALRRGRRMFSVAPLYLTLALLERGRYDYDIVQCHFGSFGQWAVVLRRLGVISGKVVTMFHGMDIRSGIRYGGDIYANLKREGDCFLSISPYNRGHLLAFGFPEERIVDHPVGVDTSFFAPARSARTGQDGRVTILSVARLVPEKGLRFGISAVRKLTDSFPERDIRYRIVGSGNLLEELRSHARELGLSGVVRFLGEGNDRLVRDEMQNADVYLLPSRNEALPVSIMEALSSGLPVVASNVGSVSELVRDGVSGFLVETGDVDAIAGKLGHLARDPDLRAEMGRAGRRHIEAHYDIEMLNDRLVEIYGRLASERPV